MRKITAYAAAATLFTGLGASLPATADWGTVIGEGISRIMGRIGPGSGAGIGGTGGAAGIGDAIGSVVGDMAGTAAGQAVGGMVEGARRAPAARPTPFAPKSGYTLCFTPDGASCEQLLVRHINNSRSNILVQAYSFTNKDIAAALARAKARGVDVRVILDKSQRTERYTSATYLKNHQIPVWVDEKPAIAHNKVMIFDQQHVFTGSFNFSSAAEKRNTENGIVISHEPNLIQQYVKNWVDRVGVSVRM